MRHDPPSYLADILHAIDLIERFVAANTFEDYLEDENVRAVVERHLITVGEALTQLRRIDEQLVNAITDSVRIIGFRNVLVHEYAVVRPEVSWDAATNRLPLLRSEVSALLPRRGDL